jgi:hypothetical protein
MSPSSVCGSKRADAPASSEERVGRRRLLHEPGGCVALLPSHFEGNVPHVAVAERVPDRGRAPLKGRRDLTQAQVAEALGVNVGTITTWERPPSGPPGHGAGVEDVDAITGQAFYPRSRSLQPCGVRSPHSRRGGRGLSFRAGVAGLAAPPGKAGGRDVGPELVRRELFATACVLPSWRFREGRRDAVSLHCGAGESASRTPTGLSQAPRRSAADPPE